MKFGADIIKDKHKIIFFSRFQVFSFIEHSIQKESKNIYPKNKKKEPLYLFKVQKKYAGP